MEIQGLAWEERLIRKEEIDLVQINIGNRCNQSCSHCHIGASPKGSRNMDHRTARNILDRLLSLDIDSVEFTGGTPELNPNFRMFIEELSNGGKNISVRTSLTVLDLPEYSYFIDLYKKHRVRLIASLPDVFGDLTDRQRGRGVFDTSITVLKKLNGIGYGTNGLRLDLVYNPDGDYLPPNQSQIERDYRKLLRERHGISFNGLITIVNSPIARFKSYLVTEGKLDSYMRLLVNNFNPETLEKVMCRHQVSVDYLGHVYDCDFNLALGIRTKGYEDLKFWEIAFNDFTPEITCAEHCYACTVNVGSSCHGTLIKEEPLGVRETVKNYYGEVLRSSADLKTTACCTPDSMPLYVRETLPYIADEIKAKYYGCGSPIPLVLKSMKVLDLGCGTGRDSYVMSRLVGERGFVYGIDMTENQIGVARKYIDEQTRRFGYEKPNVLFIHDYIENAVNHVAVGSLDIVTSNCVINLLEDKEAVIGHVYDMLKFGGEFYFSDIYADRRVPAELRTDPVLYGECLGGALYWKDFERIARRAGFADPRVVSKRVVDISNEEIRDLVGNIIFYSITYRLLKLDGVEDACEDYGHVAIYRGGIAESPFAFTLDAAHVFERDKPERVCGNTALMLARTRFGRYFEIMGSFERHFGLFENCGSVSSKEKTDEGGGGCSCC